MGKTYFFILLLLLTMVIGILVIAKNVTKPKALVKNDKKQKTTINLPKTKPITIYLQPFSGFPDTKSKYLLERLKGIYSNCKLLPSVELPQTAFYPPRNRYRADSLIRWLSNKVKENDVIAGMASEDISTTKGTNPDSGIFGLGYMPGPSCVISNFRLKQYTDDQLFKVLIHELGHTQGVDHCPLKTCFMRDAMGKNVLMEETEFCPDCRKKLIAKGWHL